MNTVPLTRIKLDVRPLAVRIDARAQRKDVSVTVLLTTCGCNARMWYGARKSGTVTAAAADKFAVRVLGMTLDEIYGPNWDDEVAA